MLERMEQKGEYPRLYCYKKKMELGENQEGKTGNENRELNQESENLEIGLYCCEGGIYVREINYIGVCKG